MSLAPQSLSLAGHVHQGCGEVFFLPVLLHLLSKQPSAMAQPPPPALSFPLTPLSPPQAGTLCPSYL